MARALRDAGFKVLMNLYVILLDGQEYQIDADLVQWQQDAISGKGMDPMAMQFDFERRSVRISRSRR